MKLQLTPRFPAQVVGSGRITVTKVNGIFTIGLDANEPEIASVDPFQIDAQTGAVAVIRNNPVTTTLLLPDLTLQAGIPIHIIDWSTNVVNHQIILTPFGAQTIMRAAAMSIFSNAQQLGSAVLNPSVTLNGWYP